MHNNTRATFIVDRDQLSLIKKIAWEKRVSIKDVVKDAFAGAINEYLDKEKSDSSRLTKKPQKEKETHGKAELIFDLWNEFRGALPEAFDLTKKRRAAANQRWKEHPYEEFWIDVFKKLNEIPFYCGKNDRQWFANFDYILRPGKALEVIERPVFEAPKKVQTMGVLGSQS